MEFKIGDIVVLKSGGPKMTVSDTSNWIGCHWFVGTKLQQGNFPPDALTKFDESKHKWLPGPEKDLDFD